MFRIWGKIFKDNHLVRDLQQPIWLDKNINEFKRVDKTRFEQDNFIEQIDFDYLEIEVIEEQQTKEQ